MTLIVSVIRKMQINSFDFYGEHWNAIRTLNKSESLAWWMISKKNG